MKKLSLTDIVLWTKSGGMPYDELRQPADKLSDSVKATTDAYDFGALVTDSRSIQDGQIFLALTGTSFDGHNFIETAVERGATLVIARDGHPSIEALKHKYADLHVIRPSQVERISISGKHRLIVVAVPDTLLALQQIACGYRHKLKAKVIAVTGSVGKTSTREMISCCLSVGRNKVHQTSANLNNEIGLPQTLLAADDYHDYIVVEMGMRGLGQIELLSKIACPDIAVITNIGWSHLELLGSRENILLAKTEITAGMNSSSTLVLNYDDSMLVNWYQACKYSVPAVLYSESVLPSGMSVESIWAEQIITSPTGSEFMAVTAEGKWHASIKLPGKHHISNALAGIMAAKIAGVEPALAAERVSFYRNTGQRQRIIQNKGICIMDDTYNAAPESMLTAIRTIADMAAGNRVIGVLAGMLELGDYSDTAHHIIGEEAARLGLDKLCLFGDMVEKIKAGALAENSELDIKCFSDHDSLISYIKEIMLPGDFLLVKGSRAFNMDRITAELEAYLEE